MTRNDEDATMNIPHSVLYRLWRSAFFPIAMVCLFIVGGAKALVTWAAFALIVYRVRQVSLGTSYRPVGHKY